MADEVQIGIIVEAANAGKSIKEIKDLLKETEKAGEEAGKKVDKGLKKVDESAVSLKTQLRNMKDELATLDQGSAEFKQLANDAAVLEDTIKDVDAQIRFLSSDTKNLDTAVQAVQGFAGGFQAAQGAAALFGSEQKEIQEAIQKVIAVQGIMNGVQQVSNVLQRESILGNRLRIGQLVKWAKGTKIVTLAQKGLNLVMKANPIGLIITAVAALIAVFLSLGDNFKMVGNWFIKLGGWVKETIDGFGKMKYVILALLGPIGLLIAAWDFFFGEQAKHSAAELARLEAEKKAREEANKQNVEDHKRRLSEIEERRKAEKKAFEDKQTEFDLDIERMEAEGKNAQALRIAKQEAVIQEVKDQIQAIRDIEASWTEYYERQALAQGKSREEYIEILKGQGIDVVALQEELNGEIDKLDQQLFSNESKLIKLKLEGKKEAATEEVETEDKKLKDIEALNTKHLAEIRKAEDAYLLSKLSDQEQEVFKVQEKYQRLIDLAIQQGEDTALLEEAQAQAFFEIDEKYRQLELDAEQAAADERQRIKEEEAAARIETIDNVEKTAQDVLSITENLNTIIHGKELKRIKEKRAAGEKLTQNEIKRLKREDQIRKAQALAQIAADTARGISGAIASGAGVGFPANLAAIAAGVAAVLSGVAQASQVLGESVDIGNVSAGGGGDVSTDTIEQTGQPQLDPLGFGSSLLNEPNKVFVVESDITDVQDKVSVLEQAASFG